jgi:hypothetical protein
VEREGAFWDSPLLAITLEAASNHSREEAVALLNLPKNCFLMRRSSAIECASRAAERALLLNTELPVQKTYYNSFRKALYGETNTNIFEKRIKVAFSALCNPVPVIDWTPAATFLKAAPSHAAVVVLRTWANSWTTSTRYHDRKTKYCCSGCPAELDDLAHYLVCQRLWHTVTVATQTPCSDDVLEKLCIRSPSRSNLLNLLVASGTYHTFKMQYLERVCEASENQEYIAELIATIATFLARDWTSGLGADSEVGQGKRRIGADFPGLPCYSAGGGACEPASAGVAISLALTTVAAQHVDPLDGSDVEGHRITIQDLALQEAAPSTPRLRTFPATPEWWL